ncbi:MAG: DNA polymerase III subunit alpha [Chromatiales bacterium]|nr:DNA polymerase III subunit alpha [Chromatiales bacterium]
MTGFVHLHVHTEYSLSDGLARVKPLAAAAARAQMPALAVTEQGNLFSMVKFYRAAIGCGVKPVVGVDLLVAEEGPAAPPTRLVLLCQDLDAYRRLGRLVSRSYTQGRAKSVPTVTRAWIEEAADGLIALSGGPGGDVAQAALGGRDADARRRLEYWLRLFPDRYFLELHRTGRPDDEPWVEAALDLAAELDAPVVATNDVRFLTAADFDAHEARVCIHDGRILADPRRPRRYTDQQYLKTPQEMAELFADLPEALANSVEIAKRCNLELELGKPSLPEFPVPPGNDVDSWLREQARVGLERRLETAGIAGEARAPYDERLAMELDVIVGMGFPGYFLIVADFIEWAREHGVPVGPGRGSGAGSLVAWSLRITDLDPIAYDLLFERFLNPERVSMPDFDIDFCMDGRDRVIDYVAERYAGAPEEGERVSQIITFGSMAAKAVVRDVGRVLGHPYGYVDQLAKLIPFELGITLERALAEEPLRSRYEQEEEVRILFDLARSLEGIARNAGRHAGGVVIAPGPLTEFTPLYCEPGSSSVVTQFDKDDVEAIGLVKFDFLGLRTLTIIDRAVRTINDIRAARGEPALDMATLPTADVATYDLIKRGATTAVFQLESRGMKELIRRLLPDRFDDVVALVALFRPGPLQSGMVDDFIDRKHGRAAVEYPHPELEPILRPTYGVILYQEQVMQIAQVLAGYTLGGADLLRRAMGKKKPEEMAKQREVFVGGATGRGVDEGVASYIFDLMEKFAGYGFNKSHSAAYALLSYHTAWLKAHYPAAFMAAVLSADMDNTDKVVVFIDECRDLGLRVLPPDVNHCEHPFTVAGERVVRYGLGAVKGVGEGAVGAIIEERERDGPYADLFDFCRRIDTKRVNRRTIEALVRGGALDALGPSRASMMATLTYALQAAEQLDRDATTGQDDLFGGTMVAGDNTRRFVEVEEWSEPERLSAEKETLGLYLTGHPIAEYEAELAHITATRLVQLRPTGRDQTAVAAGLVVGLRSMNSRKGRMAVATLDDRTARVEAVLYSDVYQRSRDLLVKDRLLVVEGEVREDEVTGGCSMVVSRVLDIETARERHAKRLAVRLDDSAMGNGMIDALAQALESFRPGATPICIDYRRRDAAVRLPLGDDWRVRPTEELLGRLRELAGADHVQVEYS